MKHFIRSLQFNFDDPVFNLFNLTHFSSADVFDAAFVPSWVFHMLLSFLNVFKCVVKCA